MPANGVNSLARLVTTYRLSRLQRVANILFAVLLVTAIGAYVRSSQPPNVVIVLIDTLRADRLGAYGNVHGLTPSLDSFAGSATLFRNAYAQSSWTNPSIASLFTSRYQSEHRVISFGSVLDDREETLAENLSAIGYDTAAFVANILLQAQNGFAQGFATWKTIAHRDSTGSTDQPTFIKGSGDEVNRATFSWLDGRADRRRPLFLYIHYMEPHAPYDLPPANGFDRSSLDPVDPTEVNRYMQMPTVPMPDDLLPTAERLYDAEVHAVDSAIGNLLTGLRTRGVLDDAIVVVLGDHGEELKDHGLVGHHQTLYQEVIHVPLLICMTAHSKNRIVEEPVSVIDVAPTILQLVGARIPAQYEGHSRAQDIGTQDRWALLRPAPELVAASPVFSELIKPEGTLRLAPHERAVVTSEAKEIVGIDGQRSYFDLANDPKESDPNALAPAARAALDSDIHTLIGYGAPVGGGTPGAVDAGTQERMRALGYSE